MWLPTAVLWTAFTITVVTCFAKRSLIVETREEDFRTDSPSFDLELFQTVVSQTAGNIALSPTSVAAVLRLLHDGAGGITANQIRDALRLNEDEVFYRQTEKDPAEQPSGGSYARTGTSVFVDANLEISREFEYKARLHFSTLKSIPFREPAKAVQAVNTWASDVTGGKVTEIVTEDSLSVDVLMLLANVVYFEGTWEKEFYQNFTTERPFYLDGYKPINVPTMIQQDSYLADYIKPLNAYAVQLPYSGDRYSMLLIVPHKKDGIGRLMRDLPYYSLDKIMGSLTLQDVDLRLPKFKLDYEESLVPALQMLGISALFTNAANLTGISDMGVKVSDTIHRASIDVNEKGTVAYASTVAMIVPLMGSLNLVVNADHPFLFFIHDNFTRQFIFMGRVSDPRTMLDNEIEEKETTMTPPKVEVTPPPNVEVTTPLSPSVKPDTATGNGLQTVQTSASTPTSTPGSPTPSASTPGSPTPSASTPGLFTPSPISSTLVRKLELQNKGKLSS